jgi:hypothetical protein
MILFINLRDNNNYQYNNFWSVFIENPTAIQKTLNTTNGNPDGTLLGNGFTDIKKVIVLKRM